VVMKNRAIVDTNLPIFPIMLFALQIGMFYIKHPQMFILC